jgi:uncharacterized SAM-binding protein YcdF (DUF218 family)
VKTRAGVRLGAGLMSDSLAKERRHHLRRRVAVALLIVFVAWIGCWLLAKSLTVKAPLEHADALVVLSGSATYVERTRYAAELYHRGLAPLIIVTNDNHRGGWSNEEERNPLFVERAVMELKRVNVPAEKILVLPEPVSSTYEEAMLLRQYGSSHGYRSLMFITSAYHSRRALWTLRHVFDRSEIQIGLDAVEPGEQSPKPLIWWATLRGWRQVALEYPKLFYYWLRYRSA